MCPYLSLSAANDQSALSSFDSAAAVSSITDLPDPWPLHHGGELERARLAWELAGNASAPVVAVLGGISAGRHVTATYGDPRPGWWSDLVGPGRAIDTAQYRVLGIDFLGGNDVSTGPQHVEDRSFPSIDTRDQARALAHLLEHLEIPCLHAFVGSSYGGMVALAFSGEHSELVERTITVSGAHRSHPQSTAWRSLQRRAVRLGQEVGEIDRGLSLSRGLAMVSYRSPEELDARFDRPPRREEGVFRFPVEDYLEARGRAFASRFDPDSFLVLSESIDLHSLDPASIQGQLTVVAVPSDQLVPYDDLQSLATSSGGPSSFVELDSFYGHDAFLKESERLGEILRAALEEEVSS